MAAPDTLSRAPEDDPTRDVITFASVIAEPARETLMTKLAQPGARGSYMGFSRLGLALGGMTGYVGGGALHDYAMLQGQPWLPWLVLGTVGVTTLLLLVNCFHREPSLARVNI